MYLKNELIEDYEAKGDKGDEDNKNVDGIAIAVGIKRGKCKNEKKRFTGIERRKRYKDDTEADGAVGSNRPEGTTGDKDVDGKKVY
jgi:hypothetical protein